MLLPLLAVIAGFGVLIWAADRFVYGAAATARNLGVPTLVVGLTIVGIGTSAPEMLVSLLAALQGNPGLAIGNAIGSNITNTGLVLGVTALVTPLLVHDRIIRREIPLLLAIMGVSLLLVLDEDLGRLDGMLLLAGLVGLLAWMAWQGGQDDPLVAEFEQEIPEQVGMPAAIFWTVIGLAALLLSSRAVVWGAVDLAQALGVSDTVIGLTIVALGTSLPELAATISGALKREYDIAVGNVIGSNMFNLLGVLGLPGTVVGTPLPEGVLARDYPVMIGLTVLAGWMAYGLRGHGGINRYQGALLVALFAGYQVLLYFTAGPTIAGY